MAKTPVKGDWPVSDDWQMATTPTKPEIDRGSAGAVMAAERSGTTAGQNNFYKVSSRQSESPRRF